MSAPRIHSRMPAAPPPLGDDSVGTPRMDVGRPSRTAEVHSRMPLSRRFSSARLLAPLALAFAAAACDGDTEPSTPAAITAVTANPAAGRVGDAVPVTVRVTTSNNRPLANQQVTFAVATGGGTVAPPTATTNESGEATVQWTLGTTVGAQALTATVGSVTPVTILANVQAGRPASVQVAAGAGQSAAVGTALPVRPTLRVLDAGGNPVPNVTVLFNVIQGGGTVAADRVTTDASGVATGPSWILGQTAGLQRLQATVLAEGTIANNPVVFEATATAGAPARVEVSGNTGSTTGTAGGTLATGSLPSVVVRDAAGNPVPNVNVTFTVTSGGGTLTGAQATTNAQGVATAGGFTLGTTAGPNVITATAQGVGGSATFTVLGSAGAPARGEVVGGALQPVRAGQPLTVGPSVRVLDRFGNPVANATVTFVVTGGGGSLLGAEQRTNANGLATVGGWTLGTTPGTNTLEARVNGTTVATFSVAGLAGAPATITRTSTDSLIVRAFQQASEAFGVVVRDSAGFAVRGATVTFAINEGGGGTLSATSVTTDSLGRASARFTGTGRIGTSTVTVRVAGLEAVTYTITTVSNTPTLVRAVAGEGQTGTAGTQLGIAPTVEVRDAAGNPVPGVVVLFNTVNGGGVQFPVDTTDETGRASAGAWLLGGTPGDYILSAIVSFSAEIVGNPVRFVARAIPLPASLTIERLQGDAQTAPAGSLLPVQPAVIVRSNGTPVAGVSVTFLTGSGSVTQQTVQTDANGIARTGWRISTFAGPNSLTAQIVGSGASVVFSATGQ